MDDVARHAGTVYVLVRKVKSLQLAENYGPLPCPLQLIPISNLAGAYGGEGNSRNRRLGVRRRTRAREIRPPKPWRGEIAQRQSDNTWEKMTHLFTGP